MAQSLLLAYLSKEEQQEFFQDPVSFVSRENYFRGMSPKKIQEAVQGGRMIPEPGDYTGKAVFLTDSPLGAAEFTPNDGSFAVIDPSKLEYMEQSEEGVKVHDIFSDEYKELERKYISSLPEDEQGLAAYTAINRWDTMSKYSQSKPWHTIAMRKDQPVSSVRAFVVFDKITKDVTVLDPSKEEDMEKLWEHFEIERAAV
ncbi:MAG: hypothetical protein QGG82_01780 [Patescibacteria group bacterium]|nr:hypothetical protein [Patescibacteria group bacterium]